MTAVTSQASADLALAQRHRHGDDRAFDEVYRRFAPMVYNLALRLSGRAEVAEDLSQEIFIRIFRHLGRFNGRSSLKTWIYRVTVNHCRSRLGRRRWLTRPLAEDDADFGVQLVDERRDPESRTLAGDVGRRVAEGLRLVKPVFREAVVLRDLEGLSYQEIAQVLGVRLGTVRSRIARGREQLRVYLEQTDEAADQADAKS
ncbi:MAG: sigma-70 family RNA polymerase sigma factor [Acidobacteria bacterium]|nr:MAG: sigma-70 family RNA polymerase sigma factor [Acidobacteriota bacterium]